MYPLAILDHRRPYTGAPWEVLVQWQVLSPDETSWENWTQLQEDYHLEDKVIIQGPKGVTNIEQQAEVNNKNRATAGVEYAKEGVPIEDKPKRRIKKHAYLNDFV